MIPQGTIAARGIKRPLAQAFRGTRAWVRARALEPSTVLAMRIG